MIYNVKFLFSSQHPSQHSKAQTEGAEEGQAICPIFKQICHTQVIIDGTFILQIEFRFVDSITNQ